jgi:hypothetical protein
MAGLLEHDKTQTPEGSAPQAAAPVAPGAPVAEPAGAPEVPAEPAGRPCATCAAPLAGGQDWCLECGSAQPGRLGTRAGWRAALSVAGACAVLATGAGAAAYAALSSESQRVASAAAPPAATPTVTPPPVVAAPPPAVADVPTVEAPPSAGADVPPAKAPAVDPPSSPDTGGSSDTAGASDSARTSGDTDGDEDAGADADTPADPVATDLSGDAASTYDPYDRGGANVGDPADAVDGKAATAWEAPVGDDGKADIGLAVSLDEARTLSQLAFKADTPGFTVEIYGSRAEKLPPDVLDARWENIDTRKDVGVREEVELKGKYRHVLLWVTEYPGDKKVAIAELQLFR